MNNFFSIILILWKKGNVFFMVKNSLQSLLDKYPYFLNKSEESNFYKVQWVNNENFKTLYNDLFKVYESFHLTKNLLIMSQYHFRSK